MADYVDDLPADWEPSISGSSWFKVDKSGNDWQAYVEDGMVVFRDVTNFPLPPATTLTEEKFKELFE